jgi:acyl carrier protein
MESLKAQLETVFRAVFDDATIALTAETTAADVAGWDSLMHINLIVAVEKHFGVRFATAEISRLKGDDQNIASFLALLASKLG